MKVGTGPVARTKSSRAVRPNGTDRTPARRMTAVRRLTTVHHESALGARQCPVSRLCTPARRGERDGCWLLTCCSVSFTPFSASVSLFSNNRGIPKRCPRQHGISGPGGVMMVCIPVQDPRFLSTACFAPAILSSSRSTHLDAHLLHDAALDDVLELVYLVVCERAAVISTIQWSRLTGPCCGS